MNTLTKKEDYPYLYETHMHTSQSSACAHSTGREMAQAAKEAGYTGIIITDHNWYGNNALDSSLPWAEWIEEFCRGYEDAREWGEKAGLDVFFGYEAGYGGPEFLIYGVDQSWLIAHPEIKDASVQEQYRLIHGAGGMVIHAHPFRRADYIPEVRLFPGYVDGVEGINAAHSSHLAKGHRCPEYNTQAVNYGRERELIITGGSDIHIKELTGGGMAFKRKLQSIEDFCQALRSGEDCLLTDGDTWYDRTGEPL